MRLRHSLHGLKVAYYRRAPRLRRLLGGKRRVLLFIASQAMLSHLLAYYDCVRDMPDTRFFYLYPDMPDGAARDPAHQRLASLPIARVNGVGLRAWDLIVSADMPTPSGISKEMTPLLYVNHGLHIISKDGGERLYCYGEHALDEHGQPTFTRMLESNARIAREMLAFDPRFAPVIAHTGFKFAGSIARAVAERDATRRALGVDDGTTLVGFFGTWREHSLFHALGAELFDACEAMRKDGYQFLFSIHPREYARYDPDIEPMGALVERQRARGMLVRGPGEPFEPAMAACDIVVSDYSSMAESAIIAERKLVFSPYPDGMVWKRSLTAQARRELPTLPDALSLRPVLEAVRAAPLDPFILQARKELVRDDHDQAVREITRELLEEDARHA